MKYLVNRETKEHRVVEKPEAYSYHDWKIVEADADGWIPWNGGECPLPDNCECEIKAGPSGRMFWERTAKVNNWNTTVAYRPILAEKEEALAWDGYIEDGQIELSVFDRLRQATEAAESIPAILAEINALLPEWYCVTKREVVNMQDWRNWEKGDFVTVHGGRGGYSAFDFEEGKPYEILSIEKRKDDCIVGLDSDNDHKALNFLAEEIEADELRFHSRPVKS